MLYRLMTVIIIVFSISISGFSQEQIGLRTGQFAGVHSIFLNPGYSSHSPLKWDINVISAQFFFETDYGFIRNTNFIHLIKNQDQVTTITDLNNPVDSVISMPLYFDTNGGEKSISLKGQVMGPSAIFNLGKDLTGGFFMSYNFNGNAQNISESLGYYELRGIPDTTNIIINPSRAAAMSWAEIGLHLSKSINTNYTHTAVGLNLKYLMGLDALFARNDEAISFQRLESGEYLFNNMEAELGFTTPSLDASSIGFNSNGRGIAIDLGVSFKNERSQLGISILDLGFTRFGSNTEIHYYSSNELINIANDSYSNVEDYRELLNQANQDFPQIGIDSLTVNNRPFSIWMPTAISAQFDHNLFKKLFVNASIIQRVPIGKNRLERDNIMFVAPRFDSRLFSVYLPLTLYNFNKVNLGFAMRFGILSVGSDNITSLMGKGDFSGTDIYAAIKVNPFNIGKKHNRDIKCYYFEN